MNKKAQGISINTIIVAAIALLVLVILSVIFMIRMGVWSVASNDCGKFQGSCDYGRSCPSGMIQHPTAACYDGNEIDRSNVCCVRDIG